MSQENGKPHMFVRTVQRGMPEESQYDLMVYSLEDGVSEHSRGVVTHFEGRPEVHITSTERGWSSCPVYGEDNLRLLRDALVDICQKLNIE